MFRAPCPRGLQRAVRLKTTARPFLCVTPRQHVFQPSCSSTARVLPKFRGSGNSLCLLHTLYLNQPGCVRMGHHLALPPQAGRCLERGACPAHGARWCQPPRGSGCGVRPMLAADARYSPEVGHFILIFMYFLPLN